MDQSKALDELLEWNRRVIEHLSPLEKIEYERSNRALHEYVNQQSQLNERRKELTLGLSKTKRGSIILSFVLVLGYLSLWFFGIIDEVTITVIFIIVLFSSIPYLQDCH